MSYDHFDKFTAIEPRKNPLSLWHVFPLLGMAVFLSVMLVIESICAIAVFVWDHRPHWSREK